MPKLPSTIMAPTQARLDHQFKDWETRHYIHPPEFDEAYERLTRNHDRFHSDWKSR